MKRPSLVVTRAAPLVKGAGRAARYRSTMVLLRQRLADVVDDRARNALFGCLSAVDSVSRRRCHGARAASLERLAPRGRAKARRRWAQLRFQIARPHPRWARGARLFGRRVRTAF